MKPIERMEIIITSADNGGFIVHINGMTNISDSTNVVNNQQTMLNAFMGKDPTKKPYTTTLYAPNVRCVGELITEKMVNVIIDTNNPS